MNTGLLLKKPGESPYARFRRFLIANHGCYKAATSLRKALINTNIDIDVISPTDGIILTSDIATKYESELIQVTGLKQALPTGSINRYDRPHRHCQKCTDLVFHSDLFELPWIEKCPLHNIALTSECESCGHELSSSSALFNNHCESCGSKIGVDEIITRHETVNVSSFEIFHYLEEIINVDHNLFPDMIFLDRDRQYTVRRQPNENTVCYPSILRNMIDNTSSLDKGFEFGIIHRYETETREYRLLYDRNTYISYEMDLKLKAKNLNIISKKVRRVLENEVHKHALGKCLGTNRSFRNMCVPCKILKIWIRLVPYELNEFLDLEIDNYFKSSVEDNIRSLVNDFKIEFPEAVYYLDLLNSKHTIYRIPIAMTEKLYQLDLWSIFLLIFRFLSIIRFSDAHGVDRIEGRNQYLHPLAWGRSPPLCPFYIQRSRNTLAITYPKMIAENCYGSSLSRLLSL